MVRDHGTQTSIIIIDDLHWLDEASEEFVATLADAVAMARTTLVIKSRPGYFAQWMRFSHHRQIELAELNSSDTEILVHELVGLEPKLEEIRQHIATRSPA